MEHPHAAQPLAARQEPAACHPLDRVMQGAVEAPCPLVAQAWAMPVLQQAAQRLGVVPGRLAHVGDSRTDIESACNAGAAAWAVPYGYNGGEPIEAAAPQRIFVGLAEVAAHVIDLRSAR